jgi:hypothetical protein
MAGPKIAITTNNSTSVVPNSDSGRRQAAKK